MVLDTSPCAMVAELTAGVHCVLGRCSFRLLSMWSAQPAEAQGLHPVGTPVRALGRSSLGLCEFQTCGRQTPELCTCTGPSPRPTGPGQASALGHQPGVL